MSINPPIAYEPEVPEPTSDNGYEFVDLSIAKPDPEALAFAPGEFALNHNVLPMGLDGETLVVAMGSIQSLQAVDDLGIIIGRAVMPVLADPKLIRERIEEYFLEKILQGS